MSDPVQSAHEVNAECAICFEKRPFVDLPCSCRVQYCASCWDRSLAATIAMLGKARCPSCRTGFHVDFNQDNGLVFSEAENPMTIAEWLRFYDRSRFVQIQLLQDFGTTAGAAMKRSFSLEGNLEQMHGCHARCEPMCICGGSLQKVDVRTRMVRILEDTRQKQSTMISGRCIDELVTSSLITCDLCHAVATNTGFVWTCSNGPNTVLHPAAFDICEKCFSHHVDSHESSSQCSQGDTTFDMGFLSGAPQNSASSSCSTSESPPPGHAHSDSGATVGSRTTSRNARRAYTL